VYNALTQYRATGKHLTSTATVYYRMHSSTQKAIVTLLNSRHCQRFLRNFIPSNRYTCD